MTVVAALLGLLLLLAAALAVPLDVEVRRPGRHAGTSVRLSWLFGLVRREPAGTGTAGARGEEATPAGRSAAEAEEERADGRGRPGPGIRRAVAALRTPGLVAAAGRLLPRLARAVRRGRAAAILRLGDPADTGRLWGVLAPFLTALPAGARRRLALRPDFTPGDADVRGFLRLRLVPLRVAFALAAFLLTPAVARAGWRAARAA